ncbi:MAG TPA: hypothetical protein VE907_08975 [Gammaproteobacteria bacterium]|nr:hypothetical protein [Gammaproteobacteria bacterium]
MTTNADDEPRGAFPRMVAWTAVIGFILLLPLIAMQFTDEVVWDGLDFAAAAALLIGAAVTYELVARTRAGIAYRAGVAVAVATGFALAWANGAVGIIGNEHDDVNLIFAGVLAVALIGALLARFRPIGMARAMAATALAQVLVAVIAFTAGWGAADPSRPRDIVMATAFFTPLWLVSAGLFRKTAGPDGAKGEL